ncbi:MAG: pilin [Candidatus Saccharimonadales bacterium]
MNAIKQLILSGFLVFTTTLALAPAVAVYAAEPIDEACTAINCDNPKGLNLSNVIKQVITILGTVIGIVAVIMIMVGGFKYITASGDSSKVSSAKNTIIYAVIGLVIAALAQVIVRYVIDTTI